MHQKTTVSAHLVSDPGDDYRKINLFVTQVDVKADTDWVALAKPERVYDLQKGGGEQLIAKGVRLQRGGYDQLRLFVDPARSNVELKDGSSSPLGLAKTLRGGIELKVMEGPAASNLVYDLILNLDAGRSVLRTEDPGGASSYTFFPVARLNDRDALGILSGRIVDAKNQPLRAVKVMAQDGEGPLGNTLVRTVRTGADGTYRLDLLPVNRTYYVVAQPRSGGKLYAAQASAGARLTRLDRNKRIDLPPFHPATEAAGPEVSVEIPTDRHLLDQVDLLQPLATGTRRGNFIIQAAQALPGPGGSSGSHTFAPAAEGKYLIRFHRSSLEAAEDPFLALTLHYPVELKAGEPPRKVVVTDRER